MGTQQRQRVPFETDINPDRVPLLATAPTELILRESMPEICSEHGEPSVQFRPFTVSSSGPGSELPTPRAVLRSLRPARRFEAGRAQSILRFECPACAYCLCDIRRYRRIAGLLLLAIALTVIAVCIATYLGASRFYVPLTFAILPGCFPIGLLLAVVVWQRSRYFADVWLADTTGPLTVSAHPNFAVAVRQRRAEPR
ncbi:hypothetical protein [Nocardia sp. NPDC052112]|uniref:hypothetical protein n=1 Tax=Nocardia sp. NPDC052112 TaxID=3155646 RepID=UPI00342F0FEA